MTRLLLQASLLIIYVLFCEVSAFSQAPSASSAAQHTSRRSVTATRPCVHLSDYSKWDNLVSEDDDDDEIESNNPRIPADMKYVLPNIKRQSDTFDALNSMDADLISDVWLQSPADSTAWFVGRIARVSDVSPERAIDRQFPLIERHAWALRPIELHPSRGPFVVYYAPGNTEEFVGRNDPTIRLIRVEEDAVRSKDGTAAPVKVIEVGFRGASYDDEDPDVYRVDLSSWESEEVEDESSSIENELRGFAIPETPEEDAEMQALADKLRTKDIDKFFDDDDWKEFVDKSFPTSDK